MSTYEILLVLHILGALLIAGGAGIGTAAGIAMTRTSSVPTLGMLAQIAHRGEFFAVVPGAALTFAFGTWLVIDVGYGFGEFWISAAYMLWIAAMAIGTGVLAPEARRLHAEATRLMAEGVTQSEELRARASAPKLAVLGNLLHLITLTLLVLMVVRPGA